MTLKSTNGEEPKEGTITCRESLNNKSSGHGITAGSTPESNKRLIGSEM
jgi:hypothetical protein